MSKQRPTALERMADENTLLKDTLNAALEALRSYQMGNYSPDFAKEVADKIEQVLKGEGR